VLSTGCREKFSFDDAYFVGGNGKIIKNKMFDDVLHYRCIAKSAQKNWKQIIRYPSYPIHGNKE
jgi:hypothetical protein